jgi:hypothetical protein
MIPTSLEELMDNAHALETRVARVLCADGIEPSGALALAFLSLAAHQAAAWAPDPDRERFMQTAGALFDFHFKHNRKR